MRQYITLIREWTVSANQLVMARVIETWGSSPRPVGSVMLISQDGKIGGSVSGGCVEGEVVQAALELFNGGRETKVMHFGVSNEEAWSVGLSCGGKLTVLVQLVDLEDKLWAALFKEIENNHTCHLFTRLADGASVLKLHSGEILSNHPDFQKYTSDQPETGVIWDEKSEPTYFNQNFERKNTLLIIGVAHITVDLIQLAKLYDFETIVVDPRGYFGENTSFKVIPDQLHIKYPSEVLEDLILDGSTYCAVLSHDPKIDDDALKILLRSDVAYIGALGSRKTNARRIERLQAKGFGSELDRIHAPIGIDINAKTASEIAMSIMAEVIQVRNSD